MTDITTYPLEDWFETELSQARDGAVWTIYVNDTPSFTFPAWVTTYIIVDPGKTTMQLAKINAYNSTLKTITVSSISVNKWASVAYTQQSHQIGAKVRISHNYQFWKDIVDAVNTKVNTNDDDIAQGKFADATARDAYFTSPVNGNSAYLTAEWKRTDYVAWAWADRASWTNQNASDTVAGRVEIATQAEFDAWTATGWTWASVVATNDQIRKQISTATAKTTPVNADSIGISDSAASWVIKKTTLTQLKAASDMQATTTTSGFVEMATDAEAIARTATDKVITPANLAATQKIVSIQFTRDINAASWAVTYAHWLSHTPRYIEVFGRAVPSENTAGFSDWTVNNCVRTWYVQSSWSASIIAENVSNACVIFLADDGGWSWNDKRRQTAVATFDATNVTLTRTLSTIWSIGTTTVTWYFTMLVHA